MKKKKMAQEETMDANQNKSTDNKGNTHNEKDIDNKNSDLSPAGDRDISGAERVSSTDKFVQELKIAEEKLAEMQDKYIRLSAEFDNYRKRTLREKMDMSKYAGENILLNILPLMDDFDRALKHMDNTSDCVAMKDGIDLIYVKFNDFFKQNGVKEIESLNCDFNVDVHEAVAKVPAEDSNKKGKVIDVILKGYYLQDKVLRFSKVVVGE